MDNSKLVKLTEVCSRLEDGERVSLPDADCYIIPTDVTHLGASELDGVSIVIARSIHKKVRGTPAEVHALLFEREDQDE